MIQPAKLLCQRKICITMNHKIEANKSNWTQENRGRLPEIVIGGRSKPKHCFMAHGKNSCLYVALNGWRSDRWRIEDRCCGPASIQSHSQVSRPGTNSSLTCFLWHNSKPYPAAILLERCKHAYAMITCSQATLNRDYYTMYMMHETSNSCTWYSSSVRPHTASCITAWAPVHLLNDTECSVPSIHIWPGPSCWRLLIPSNNARKGCLKVSELGVLAIDDCLLRNCVAWCWLGHRCCILC